MLSESCSTNIVAYSVIVAKLIVDPDLAATAKKMGGVVLGKLGYLPKYLSRHLFANNRYLVSDSQVHWVHVHTIEQAHMVDYNIEFINKSGTSPSPASSQTSPPPPSPSNRRRRAPWSWTGGPPLLHCAPQDRSDSLPASAGPPRGRSRGEIQYRCG